MQNRKCQICDNVIEIPDNPKHGQRITCPHCFAQQAIYLVKGTYVIGCAICKETIFDPENCENCERRREKRRLLEEGRL